MSNFHSSSRRDFLKTGLAGGVILGLPAATYQAAFSAETPPSEQIRLGFIGVGRQGTSNLKAFARQSMVRITALADVDKSHLSKAEEEAGKAGAMGTATNSDYRKLLDSSDVDAVVVTTPDHWHALQTIHACQAGKDVYCEKPLTLVIEEGRKMVEAARKNNRIVQTGSQQRSDTKFRTACELVRNGAIGKVHTVKVGLPGPNFQAPGVPDSDPPEVLDYEFWLGPAPERPYNVKRVHYLFRFFWDYSGGQQTNFGAHHLDIAQWGLGMDEGGPTKVQGEATFNKEGWFETPVTAKITYTYATGTKMLCSLGSGGYPGGTTFEGEKGKIYVNRGKLEIDPAAEIEKAELKEKLYVSNNHHRNFLDCIKSREKPICDVEIGHRSATVCHLGNIAIRLGRELTWNPAKEEFVGDKEAQAMVSKEYRKPWSLA